MARVEKTHTWKDNWNDVVRYVLFPDEKLKEQMCLPKDVPIIQFIEKYFIEDENSTEIITNEKVRISYYDSRGGDTGNKNVRGKYKEFDIYVKDDVLHTATNDRLQNRYDLIAERLKYLQLRTPHIYGLRFYYDDEYNLWTKTPGYKRYHLVLRYNISV